MKKLFIVVPAIFLFVISQTQCPAWDYEGHRFVNLLALSSLPADFPAFVKTAGVRERIAFLGGEPDRWRNTADLNHFNAPDHYIDLEELADYGLDEHALTHYRYDFTAQLALARAAHPEKFKPIDPDKNRDHTRQLVGFLPWAITENYDKLKSTFSSLKAFEKDGGTAEEIANTRANAIYIMGVMGHYVGDSAQPLHTTKHFNGWAGENPQNFTREHIHAQVDSFFKNLNDAGFAAIAAGIHPAVLPSAEAGAVPTADTFDLVENFIINQNKQVVPLYQLEKDGKLFAPGDQGAEGHAFLNKELLAGGQFLGDLWYSAWKTAPIDTYLEKNLMQRAHPVAAASKN